jgi:hypothetical protein
MFKYRNLLLFYLQGFRWLFVFFVVRVVERFFGSDVSCSVDKKSCEAGTKMTFFNDKGNKNVFVLCKEYLNGVSKSEQFFVLVFLKTKTNSVL